MGNRNKEIKVTRESKVLKKLREREEVSLRKVGELLGLSATRVSQMESGREDVSGEYVEKFLEGSV